MSTTESGPPPAPSEYYYRRDLGLSDLMPALGLGVGVGAVTFYLARLWLERTPLAADARQMVGRSSTARRARTGNRAR